MLKIGDSRLLINEIENSSVDVCVTSPPYFRLRNYGHVDEIGKESALDDYINNLCAVFVPMMTKMKDTGVFFLNIADSYGAKKQLIPASWTLAIKLQSLGWTLRQCIIWHKPNPKPESVKDRFTNSHEYVFMFAKTTKNFFDWLKTSEPVDPSKWGISKDMIYNGKDLKEYGKSGAESPSGIKQRLIAKLREGGEIRKNKRNVWTIAAPSSRGVHCAVYPDALVENCLLAGCPDGGVVLDPFHGSGTTGRVAEKLGLDYIGFDLIDY